MRTRRQRWWDARGAVTGRLMENRCAGVFALDPDAVKALVDETNAASVKFGGLVAAMLKHNPTARPTAQDVVRYLGRGAALPTVPGGGTIVEEEDDEAEQIDLSKLALVRTLKGHSEEVRCAASTVLL